MEDEKIIALLDTKIGEEPDFVTPIPISVFNNAASIEQRVNRARDRVDQANSPVEKEIAMSEANELNELLVCGDGELMPRPEDIKHDEQTLSLYQDYVSAECTCGYHSPPPGLCENPMAHIEYCAFRTNRLRNANNIGQSLIAH